MHDYRLVFEAGSDALNDSRDTISYCPLCGTVRHDYAHGGGQTSPSYPQFWAVNVGRTNQEPDCISP